MKSSLTLFLILLSITSYAGNVCEKMHEGEDQETQAARDKSFKCQVSWIKGGKDQGAEVVLLKKACTPIDGGSDGSAPVDCLEARICAEESNMADFSAPIYLSKLARKSICSAGDHIFFGSQGDLKSPYISIKCVDGKPLKIVLRAPNGDTQSCTFP